MPRPVPKEDDPTRVGKVAYRTTLGDLAPVYSQSPVTITLRRLLFPGKSPPALDAKRRGRHPPSTARATRRRGASRRRSRNPTRSTAGAGAGRGCFGAREGVLSAGAFSEFVTRPAAYPRRGFFLGIASARRGPPAPLHFICPPGDPLWGERGPGQYAVTVSEMFPKNRPWAALLYLQGHASTRAVLIKVLRCLCSSVGLSSRYFLTTRHTCPYVTSSGIQIFPAKFISSA